MRANLLPALQPPSPAPPIERARLFLVLDARGAEPVARAAMPLRLAPFAGMRRGMAPCVREAGLAVFDAMAPRPRPVLPRPPEASPLPYQAGPLRPGAPATLLMRRCPSCGWTDVRRSAAHNAADYLLSVIGLVPYRCRTCSERFHRARTAPAILRPAPAR